MTITAPALLDFEDQRLDLLPAEEAVAIASAEELVDRVHLLAVAQLRPALNGPTIAQNADEVREILRDLTKWVDEVTL